MNIKKSIYNGLGAVYEKVSGEKPVPYKETTKQPKKNLQKEMPAEPSQEKKSSAKKLQKTTSPRDKKKLLVAGAAVLLLAVILCGVKAYLDSRPIKVYLSSMVVFSEPEGMNGSGTISYSVSRDKLREAMFGPPTQVDQSNQEAVDNAAIYEANVQAYLDAVLPNIVLVSPKDTDLSNGDTVSVEARFQTEGKSQFEKFVFIDGVSEYTVTGLEDGETIDPFDEKHVELKISGVSGFAKAELNIKKKEMYTYYLNYSLEPKEGISNGDTVTVTITPNKGKLEELGYAVPTQISKEYEVKGLDRPLESQGEITDLVLDEMFQTAERTLNSEFNAVDADDNDLVIETPSMKSIYFLDKVDKRTPYTDFFTGLNMINGVVITGSYGIDTVEEPRYGEEEPTVTRMGGYYAFIFPNILIESDGTCSYDRTAMVEKVFNYTEDSEFESWMASEFKDFSIETVGRK